MNKQTYLAKLAQLLAPLPEQERQDALNYYEEYFDAAGPEAEDATAAELGDPADAARKILEGEGLMLDSAQAAAGESSDAADTPQDAVLDIDYGRLTIVIDPGATSVALHCENIYSKRFDFTYTENEPLTIRYKVPANCDLSSEPEPEFVLSVPDAETFHFKRLSITSAMGDVEFDNNETITADSIELNLAMGDFTCSTVEAENFNATVSMGNFTGGLVQSSSFTAEVAMGNFDLGQLESAKTCTVKAGMGNIGLTVDGKADDYTLDLQASMGEVAFNGKALGTSYTQTPTTARRVTLTAGMGDVVLTTTE